MGGVHAQHHVGGDHRRTDVKRSPRRGGNPVRIGLDEGQQTRHGLLHVDLRHAHTGGGAIHAGKVVTRTEQLQTAILAAVALHALENLLRVMEDRAGRVHHERTIGYHTGVMPATAKLIVHNEHVIGKNLAKPELGFILRLFLRVGRERHRDFVHSFFLHQSSDFRRTSGQYASNRSDSILAPTLHPVKSERTPNPHFPLCFAGIRSAFFIYFQLSPAAQQIAAASPFPCPVLPTDRG